MLVAVGVGVQDYVCHAHCGLLCCCWLLTPLRYAPCVLTLPGNQFIYGRVRLLHTFIQVCSSHGGLLLLVYVLHIRVWGVNRRRSDNIVNQTP